MYFIAHHTMKPTYIISQISTQYTAAHHNANKSTPQQEMHSKTNHNTPTSLNQLKIILFIHFYKLLFYIAPFYTIKYNTTFSHACSCGVLRHRYATLFSSLHGIKLRRWLWRVVSNSCTNIVYWLEALHNTSIETLDTSYVAKTSGMSMTYTVYYIFDIV